MLSSQIKFSADKQMARQKDTSKTICPRSLSLSLSLTLSLSMLSSSLPVLHTILSKPLAAFPPNLSKQWSGERERQTDRQTDRERERERERERDRERDRDRDGG